MYKGKTILLQMQSIISGYDFKKLVSKFEGDKGVKSFTTENLLSVMLYMHMSSKQSLRDIVDSLVSRSNLWYHLGIKSLSRNNLSHALKNRPSEIFEKTFYRLLGRLQNERSFVKDKRFRFKMSVKSIDSTTVSLCLSLFDWAKFRQKKGGIKLHTIFNNKEQIPEFVNVGEAGKHDIKAADKFPIAESSIYVFDKGYICFKFLEKINKKRAFFVTRTKTNTRYTIIKRQLKTQMCIKADWIVRFSSYKSKDYSEKLRVIRFYDNETKKTYEFMTNNFNLSAKTIADIYKSRWDIELFFRWVKQNLKIKTFIGTSENAVLIQIWTAMITYLLTEYIRFVSRTSFSILKSFRIMSENILCQADIYNLLIKQKTPDVKRNNIYDLQLVINF
jgi:IS4 transposase